eukprot:TRINITY_DN32715_c0_g1_i1.p1 TRINITY_DN32715_c0_g1~~TRINITY_DN32715_c0_g1_i1.p1  ORF type:complete len:389 (-),score=68.20 TRINITY_DN32715_c0_g1_i1:40-1206(-)
MASSSSTLHKVSAKDVCSLCVGAALGALVASSYWARRQSNAVAAQKDVALAAERPAKKKSPANEKVSTDTPGRVSAPRLSDAKDAANEGQLEPREKQTRTQRRKAREQAPTAGVPSSAAARGGEAKATSREVVCCDAVEWLRKPNIVPEGAFIFTSLPDVSEVQEFAPTLADWRAWFLEASRCVFRALPPGGLAVFYQTDIRVPEVGQVSKAFIVLSAAAEVPEVSLIWHKIVHFDNVDQPSHSSNTVKYTHLLCFRRGPPDVGVSFASGAEVGGMIPDVVARGQKPWGLKNAARCMGAGATLAVLKAVSRRLAGSIHTVVDPFCGAGTVLAIGNALGLHAVGVDISPRRCKQAKALDGVELLAGRPPASAHQGSNKADAKAAEAQEA